MFGRSAEFNNMYNMYDIKLFKFGIMIDDINEKIRSEMIEDNLNTNENVELCLVFDYDCCNKYAKMIMNKAQLYIGNDVCIKNVFNIATGLSDEITWKEKYSTKKSLNSEVDKRKAAKYFVQYCKQSGENWPKKDGEIEGYKFIFWALMILTVDSNRADEYLSLICEFAKMLKITEDEFKDIIYVIKKIYNKDDKEYIFKSKSIPYVFRKILKSYK